MSKQCIVAVWIIGLHSILKVLMSLMKKTEFYQKINKYYLDKPGKKPYTAEQIESIIIAEINDAKLM